MLPRFLRASEIASNVVTMGQQVRRNGQLRTPGSDRGLVDLGLELWKDSGLG